MCDKIFIIAKKTELKYLKMEHSCGDITLHYYNFVNVNVTYQSITEAAVNLFYASHCGLSHT